MINNSTYRTVTRILICCVAALLSYGSMPSSVYAAPPVVDLVLGGEGSTSWNINNIAPGDFGIKSVTLHNAGTSDGIVSIWISDIISSEGLNPESETGDTNGSGEFSDYLLISLEATGLISNISLPTIIYGLPQSVYGSRYIRIPLGTGDTVNLDWVWVLPVTTENDAQGDSLSLTINYLLSDIIPTPPRPPDEDSESSSTKKTPEIEPPPPDKPAEPEAPVLEANILGHQSTLQLQEDGTIPVPTTITDKNQTFMMELESGTWITDGMDSLVTRIGLTIAKELTTTSGMDEVQIMATIPNNIVLLSPFYELKGYINDIEIPHVIFSQPINLTIKYDPKNLPQNALTPFIAYYVPETGLIPIAQPPGTMFEVGTVHAQVTHASFFVAAVKMAPPPLPLPPKFVIRDLLINPEEAMQGKPIKVGLTINNEGETKGSYEIYVQVDGIVRLIREITLPAQSTAEICFEITDLALGTHQIKVAGLIGTVQILRPVPSSINTSVNWMVLDLAIAGTVLIGLLILYCVKRRSRPLKL